MENPQPKGWFHGKITYFILFLWSIFHESTIEMDDFPMETLHFHRDFPLPFSRHQGALRLVPPLSNLSSLSQAMGDTAVKMGFYGGLMGFYEISMDNI